MKPRYRGLVVAALHLAIVCSLGAKLLYDRATRPRVWARTAAYDPNLLFRGRYVALRLVVHAPKIPTPSPPSRQGQRLGRWEGGWRRVALRVEDNRLVADPLGPSEYLDYNEPSVEFVMEGTTQTPVLQSPVLFFIPETAADPSRRPAGEELWVEVTLPKKGPPRPIRLGVKKEGKLTPLELN
jgi:hypothetical protein